MAVTSMDLQSRAADLRQELKLWEKTFLAANGGRKAGRDDIKACTEIAAKYKEYNKLRDRISKGTTREETPERDIKKRKANETISTPSKRLAIPSTPSRASNKPAATPFRGNQTHDVATPSSKLATPRITRTAIGPTPQRNGVVIGLFDLLPSETPSTHGRAVLGEVEVNAIQTPSRQQASTEDELCLTGRKNESKTPMSSGKRFFLDSFATPLKRSAVDALSPVTARHISTPQFLRRDDRLDLIEEEEINGPKLMPWKKRGLVRSLSTMIQDMKDRKEEERQQEEDRLDEELDLLRQLEDEEAGIVRSPKKVLKLLVEDSQAVEMRLGPDELEESQDEDDAAQAGRPGRVWKKKGQKRQTRRVIMRPNRMKPAAVPESQPADSDDDEVADRVKETQYAGHDAELSDDAFDGHGSDNDSENSNVQSRRKKPKAPASAKTKDAAPDKEGKFKKAVRKVNEQAHANFRRLKIKSKNGTGKGRFGRGRR